jgi:hypothetical protein
VALLSELKGKRWTSGRWAVARGLSQTLLELNGIEPGGPTVFVDLEPTPIRPRRSSTALLMPCS